MSWSWSAYLCRSMWKWGTECWFVYLYRKDSYRKHFLTSGYKSAFIKRRSPQEHWMVHWLLCLLRSRYPCTKKLFRRETQTKQPGKLIEHPSKGNPRYSNNLMSFFGANGSTMEQAWFARLSSLHTLLVCTLYFGCTQFLLLLSTFEHDVTG